MPELPEVQTVADHIKPEILGNYILSVDPIWNKVLDNFDSKDIEGRHKMLQGVQNLSSSNSRSSY